MGKAPGVFPFGNGEYLSTDPKPATESKGKCSNKSDPQQLHLSVYRR